MIAQGSGSSHHITSPHHGARHPHDTPGMGNFLTRLPYYLPGVSTSELLFFGRKSLGVGRVGLRSISGTGCYLHSMFLEFFCKKDFFLLPSLFVYSIIYLYHSLLMYIYFVFWVIIQHSIIYVVAQIVSALAIGTLPGLTPVSL